MGILAHIDRRADDLLSDRAVTRNEAWRVLCAEFPEIDAGLIGQRVVASAIAMGRAA